MPSRRSLTIGLLLCVTAVAFESQAVLTAMPAAAADLGDLHLYAWAFTAVVIPQLVAIAAAGRLCDTVGPARPLGVGLAIFAAGVVIAALAPSMPVLLGGRFVQGLGAGAVNLSLMVVTGLAYAPAARARLMAWFSACWTLPSLLGPAIAAWLTANLSWHWVFWAVLPFVAVGAAFLVPGMAHLPPVDPDAAASPVPLGAAVAAAVGVALLQAAGQGLSLATAPAALVGALLLAGSFPRLMPVGFGPARGGLSAVMLVRLVSTGAFFGVSSFVPFMLVQRGVALLAAGLAISLASAGWLAGSWLQARPGLRWSRDAMVVVGAAAVACGLAVVAVGAWTPASGLAVPVAGLAVAGFGMGSLSTSTSLAVMQLSVPGELGRNTSSLQVAEMLGNAGLAALAGTLFAALAPRGDAAATFGWPMGVLAAVGTLGVLAARSIGHLPNQAAVR